LRAFLDSVRPQDDHGIDWTAFRGDDVDTLGRGIARRYMRHRDTVMKREIEFRELRKREREK
jgi:hypothetical protein